MSFSANIRVDRVPFCDLIGAIPHAYPWLVEGCKTSKQDVGELIIAICEQRSQLWLISDTRKLETVGAAVTDVHMTNDGFRFVMFHSLAGRGAWHWCKPLHDAIVDFATHEHAAAVRFYGRAPWGRLFRDCRNTGIERDGHTLFERAIQ